MESTHLLSGAGRKVRMRQSGQEVAVCAVMSITPRCDEDERSAQGKVLFLTEVKWKFGCDCSDTHWAVSCIASQAPHTEPLQPHKVSPLTVLKEHRRAFIHTVLAPFEVPRMWNNGA